MLDGHQVLRVRGEGRVHVAHPVGLARVAGVQEIVVVARGVHLCRRGQPEVSRAAHSFTSRRYSTGVADDLSAVSPPFPTDHVAQRHCTELGHQRRAQTQGRQRTT